MTITIDEMLDLLSFAGAEMSNGNANHGPMASEALFALGREEAVLPWVEGYKSRLIDRPSSSFPILPDDWRDHLGVRQRLGDWIQFFERELADTPWQQVVRTWVPRLAPAVMSAATHGLIRTSHAVRSLSSAETPQRKYELAQGLGFWAATHYTLPGEPADVQGSHTPKDALSHVDRLHGPDRPRHQPRRCQRRPVPLHLKPHRDLCRYLPSQPKRPDRIRTHRDRPQCPANAGTLSR